MKKNSKSDSLPVRVLHKTVPHRTIGGIQIKELESVIEYESYNERFAIPLLLMCHDVASLRSQPIRFVYQNENGHQRSHIPDLKIIKSDGQVYFLEIKSIENLLLESNIKKYTAVASAYSAQNLHFRFLTNIQIEQQPLFSASKLLFRYRNFLVHESLISQAQSVLDGKEMQINAYLSQTKTELRDVYSLISQKHLTFDLSSPLSASSKISLPNQPHEGVTLEKILSATRFGDLLQRMALGCFPSDKSLISASQTWRQSNNYYQLWGVVGGFNGLQPLRDAKKDEFLRAPHRRGAFAPGRFHQEIDN